jgi:hypothetical protein
MENLGVDEHNIQMDHKETRWKGVDWIDLAQDRDKSRDLKLQLPQNAANFLTNWTTTSISSTLLCGRSLCGINFRAVI